MPLPSDSSHSEALPPGPLATEGELAVVEPPGESEQVSTDMSKICVARGCPALPTERCGCICVGSSVFVLWCAHS